VRAGQSLAQVEVPELVASRARQQAELKAAESDFKRLQESQERAPDLVVPQMVDQARGKYEIAAASLQQSETMLSYARIVAPFAGVVTQRFVDPGALIPAGGTPIVTLMDFSSVRLQFGVPEVESANVSAGQPVLVTTDDLPGMKLEGKVARFAYALDPATRTMLTEVSLANPELKLRPGMLVSVRLGIQRHDKALLVPVEALVTDKSGSYVWKLVGGKAQRQEIRSGFNDGKNAEVIEGLAPADAVIVVAKQALKAGQPVQAARSP
jgi:RND family efflux transporter MFP subunit